MRSFNCLFLCTGFLFSGCQTSQPNRFDQADLDSDGRLSRSEVHDYMVTRVFVARDANKDQIMTWTEWNEPSEKALFDLRDANKDGKVSLQEAKAYSLKVGTWDATMKEADTNKDGTISREEAAAYYDSKLGTNR